MGNKISLVEMILEEKRRDIHTIVIKLMLVIGLTELCSVLWVATV